ncbi:geranylgeranyl transferase type-1 subunit beta [Condylostylus longicornis]|uniref:geranylgeranyl transferase type-1 subunit beta n=1 Tax=Condylostylus longicornis TaxID=2530218 RepID=UPI00244DE550|nr:geranylgeranyl transferase type-1 subunit beta [Condylostylus longicornis]
MDPDIVQIEKHAKYFARFLKLLPARLSSHDCTRITIAFFAVSGLDVLNSLHILKNSFKNEIIEWLYRCQINPREDDMSCGGFQGSTTFITCKTNEMLNDFSWERHYQWGHLAVTYTAIATLATLGDDLSRLNRKAIIRGVEAVQKENGSFSASIQGSESDMRFVYCAAAICYMLNDWGNINKKLMADYILKSIRYDYGISQDGEMESHGGTTFCAVAALYMSDQLYILSEEVLEGMKRWLLFRQTDGFQGRPNKLSDTCYSFWIGATLKILDAFELSDFKQNRDYILSTQDTCVGGFCKWPGSNTDPFHTYFGLCGLTFIKEKNLADITPALNITYRAFNHLQKLQKSWKLENPY